MIQIEKKVAYLIKYLINNDINSVNLFNQLQINLPLLNNLIESTDRSYLCQESNSDTILTKKKHKFTLQIIFRKEDENNLLNKLKTCKGLIQIEYQTNSVLFDELFLDNSESRLTLKCLFEIKIKSFSSNSIRKIK